MTIAQQQVQWSESLAGPGFLNVPVVSNNMVSLTAWAIAEGGWFENDATYNCYNTTLQMPGSRGVAYTGPGTYVQAYVSLTQGLQATYLTLKEGPYSGIMACLQLGSDPETTVNAIAMSPWGTLQVSLQGALPSAEQAVAQYWAPNTQEDTVVIVEPDGKKYWFIADGVNSYWRALPPGANTAGLAVVADDGTWLHLWQEKG